jgi:AraC-like DNA-binding protein
LNVLSAPGEAVTLTDLATAVGTSPFYLTRLFRRELGIPLHQYVLRLRLAIAMERIRQGADPLSRLAFDLGFSSHSHFSAAFRRVFGITPSQVGLRRR